MVHTWIGYLSTICRRALIDRFHGFSDVCIHVLEDGPFGLWEMDFSLSQGWNDVYIDN